LKFQGFRSFNALLLEALGLEVGAHYPFLLQLKAVSLLVKVEALIHSWLLLPGLHFLLQVSGSG
jgi:hypothetical protein